MSNGCPITAGGPLITCRTSMGWLPLSSQQGAAEIRAAILYACSGPFTSTIQYPARTSLASGKTPSVIGVPSFPARTITRRSLVLQHVALQKLFGRPAHHLPHL